MTPLPGQPLGAGDQPVFGAPWQAQAFALAVALHERGVFTWSEWSAALAERIRVGAADDDGDDPGGAYYRQWLDALQALLERKGVAAPGQLRALQQAWAAAAERTPHGRPVELEPAERALAHGR